MMEGPRTEFGHTWPGTLELTPMCAHKAHIVLR
jgi:hypothetical protein